jgi:hypothetical protein
MEASKKVYLPNMVSAILNKHHYPQITDERSEMETIPYAYVISSVMYTMICTRPNVYVLCVSRIYQSNLGRSSHSNEVKNIVNCPSHNN